MLASTVRIGPRISAAPAVAIWIFTCMAVFYVMDGIATRDVPVYVEEFRTPGMSDEQVLSVAVQNAYEQEANGWWINEKQPFLVFDPSRDYKVTPQLMEVFDLEMVTEGYEQPIGLLRPRMASMR